MPNLVALVLLFVVVNAFNASHYRAASVMHSAVDIAYGVSIDTMIQKNLQFYDSFLAEAASNNAACLP